MKARITTNKKQITRQFWFLVGSQTLYGDDVLKTVNERAAEMAKHLNESAIRACLQGYNEKQRGNIRRYSRSKL